MNYGKHAIRKLQRELTSRSKKRLRHLSLTLIHLSLISFIGVCALVLCLGLGAFRGVLDTSPDISNIDVTPSGFSTFVYDSEGNQIAKLVSTNANRIPVTMEMIPDHLGDAFVAIEDERFYEHSGIDIQGIMRAGVIAIQTRNLSQGASTITQQLLKNNVFTGWTEENSNIERIKRKIQEQYLALQLEREMDKSTILLNYMNTINLGHNTLGVQAASLRYFGKSVNDLNLSECAVIAGITQNPSSYDPIAHPEKNEDRRKDVLDRMLRHEFISKEEYDTALADDVYSRIKVIDDQTEDDEVNSYFVDALTDQLLEDFQAAGYSEQQAYGLVYAGGLKIYATQDPKIQKIADAVCADPESYPPGSKLLLDYALTIQSANGELTNYNEEKMVQYFKENGNAAASAYFDTTEAADEAIENYKSMIMVAGDEVLGETKSLTPQPQISLTVEDQHNGHVVAMVGGRGAKTASRTLNRATDSKRQPGSTFKIVGVYAAALDAGGMSLASTQNDAPYQYADGTPVRNWYGESYRGIQTIRLGIQDSLNIVAVKTLTDITPALGFKYAEDLGITTLVDHLVIETPEGEQVFSDKQQSMGLGGLTYGVKNIDINGAYATIANDGVYIKPKLYTQVLDHDGNVLLDTDTYPERRVLKSSTSWLLTNAMQDVVTKGTGTAVNFGTTPIAGKTGTTSDYNDVWFCGYSEYYTASTWAGCDDNKKLVGAERDLAKTIWRKVMAGIHEDLPAKPFPEVPSSIKQMAVCAVSGKLPIPGLCGATRTDYFALDSLPEDKCDLHFQGNLCEYCGKPATEFCPFKISGVVTLTDRETCPHTAEYMMQPNIDAILAAERGQIEQNRLLASVEQINQLVAAAAQGVADAQTALTLAQQGGDPGAIAQAEATLAQMVANYETALVQQAAINNAGGGVPAE